MKILALIVFSIIFLIALVFSVLNFHPVEMNLYFTSIQIPLTVVLTLELLAGILIGVLATFIHIIKLKSQYAKLNKKIRKEEKSS